MAFGGITPSSKYFRTLFPHMIFLSPGASYTLPITLISLDKKEYEDTLDFETTEGLFSVRLRTYLPRYSLVFPEKVCLPLCAVFDSTEASLCMHNTSELLTEYSWNIPDSFHMVPSSGVLAPKAECKIRIIFRPQTAKVHDQIATCFFGTNKEFQKSLHLEGISKFPYLLLSDLRNPSEAWGYEDEKSVLSFGHVAVGSMVEKHVEITNLSLVKAPINIEHAPNQSRLASAFSCDTKQAVVPANGKVWIPIQFKPQTVGVLEVDYFHIIPAGSLTKSVLKVSGFCKGPSVHFSNTMVNFGLISLGESCVHTLEIMNKSDVPAYFLLDIDCNESVFRVSQRCGVLPGQTPLTLQWTFHPTNPINYYRRVTCLIHHQDPLFLDLIGTCHSDLVQPAVLQPRHLSLYRSHLARGLSFYPPDLLKNMETQKKLQRDADGALFLPSEDFTDTPPISFPDIEQMVEYFDDGISSDITMFSPHVSTDVYQYDFGSCTLSCLAEPLPLCLTNHTKGKITLAWTCSPDSPFSVTPATAEIPPLKSTAFRVTFKPTKLHTLYWAELEAFACYRVCLQKPFFFFFFFFFNPLFSPPHFLPCFPLYLQLVVILPHAEWFYGDYLSFETPSKCSLFIRAPYQLVLTIDLCNIAEMQNNFRNMKDDIFHPPWCVTVQVSGNTFQAGQEHFIPCYHLDSPTLTFPVVNPMETAYRSMLLQNMGDCPLLFDLEIKNFKAVWVKPTMGLVMPGCHQIFTVRTIPLEGKVRKHTISIRLNSSDRHMQEVTLYSHSKRPLLSLEGNGNIFFKPTCIGVSSERRYTIKNVTQMMLYFQWCISNVDAHLLSVVPTAGVIHPNESLAQTWSFSPWQEKKYLIKPRVFIWTTKGGQPDVTSGSITHLSLRVIGEGTRGSISVECKYLNLGNVLIGSFKSCDLVLLNSGSCSLDFVLSVEQELAGPCDPEDVASDPLALELEFSRGTIAARSRIIIRLTTRPARSLHYSWQINYQILTPKVLDSSHSTEELQPLCSVSVDGVYPRLCISDARTAGSANGISKLQQWRLFSLEMLNTYLERDPTPLELIHKVPTRYSVRRCPSVYTPVMLDFNFGAASVGSEPSEFLLLMENKGMVPAHWAFLFPTDLKIELEYWAESGEFDCCDLHQMKIQDNKLFSVAPKLGCLHPGQQQSLQLLYRHEFVGTDRLPVLLKLSEGREILLNFVGVTVEKQKPYIHFISNKHTFAPVGIGTLKPPKQIYELYNGGLVPVTYEIQLDPLYQLQQNNFNHKVIQCLCPKGEIPPGVTAHLEWIFSPLEARTYSVDIPIHIEGGNMALITFTGIGFDERVLGDAVPLSNFPPAVTASNSQKLPLPGQTVFLSEERISFGNIPVYGKCSRVIFLNNNSEHDAISFSWHTTSKHVNKYLKLRPVSGVLEPGEHIHCIITIQASGKPSFYKLDLVCEIYQWRALKKFEKNIQQWENEKQKQVLEFTITDKNLHQDPSSPFTMVIRSLGGASLSLGRRGSPMAHIERVGGVNSSVLAIIPTTTPNNDWKLKLLCGVQAQKKKKKKKKWLFHSIPGVAAFQWIVCNISVKHFEILQDERHYINAKVICSVHSLSCHHSQNSEELSSTVKSGGADSSVHKYKTLPPIKTSLAGKKSAEQRRWERRKEQNTARVLSRPQPPKPFLLHLGITARSHSMEEFQDNFLLDFQKQYIYRKPNLSLDSKPATDFMDSRSSGGEEEEEEKKKKKEDIPSQQPLALATTQEREVITDILSTVIRSLLDNSQFHEAILESLAEPIPYFSMFWSEEKVHKSPWQAGAEEQSPVEMLPARVEEEKGDNAMLIPNAMSPAVSTEEVGEVENEEVGEVENEVLEILRVKDEQDLKEKIKHKPEFCNLVQSILENILQNITVEASRGEVVLTSRPRVIALPPSTPRSFPLSSTVGEPSESQCKSVTPMFAGYREEVRDHCPQQQHKRTRNESRLSNGTVLSTD
ncbi:cilia- and flagella-associated protein 65 [Latimeria chalumnae]|uniref:cilia- and flagella-associated protein 65 n=1 Tax=Latimeria chalumnae TaxID=7897 RepID=UPI00313E8400